MRNFRLQMLIEATMLAAAAMVLDLLPSVKIASGISISFAMVPVFVAALRWGHKAGFFSGFLWGILQIATGEAYILHPVQAVIEYLLAFTMVGTSGFFAGKIQQQLGSQQKKAVLQTLVVALFIASFSRYFWHFVAGFYFFASFAPKEMPPLLYSFLINGTTMILTFILCVIVLTALVSVSPRILENKNYHH